MATDEVGTRRVHRCLSDAERATVCAHIRATCNQLDGVSTNVAHGTTSDAELHRMAYELVDLARMLVGLAGPTT